VAVPSAFVRRFDLTSRLIHWSLAVPFLLLLLTGLTNYAPRLKALQFAGFRVFAWAHVLLGFAMVAIALVVLLALLRSRALRAEAATLADLTDADQRWLEHRARALLGSREAEPPVGRFNAGQKLNALASTAATAALLATGVVLGVNYVQKDVIEVATVNAVFPWHTVIALATIPLVAGHIYLAAVHPGTRESLRGMTRGVVRRDWAARHHSRWVPPTD